MAYLRNWVGIINYRLLCPKSPANREPKPPHHRKSGFWWCVRWLSPQGIWRPRWPWGTMSTRPGPPFACCQIQLRHTRDAAVRGLPEHREQQAGAARYETVHRRTRLPEEQTRDVCPVQRHGAGAGGIRHQGVFSRVRFAPTKQGCAESTGPSRTATRTSGLPRRSPSPATPRTTDRMSMLSLRAPMRSTAVRRARTPRLALQKVSHPGVPGSFRRAAKDVRRLSQRR